MIDSDGSGEGVRHSERLTVRKSVQWIKHNDKSFSGSKPACACDFTDHVETENFSLVCVCAHAGLCACLCVALRVCRM